MSSKTTEHTARTQEGQIRGSINKIEPFLDKEQFEEYCDAVYTLAAYWRIVENKLKIP